MKHFLTFRSIIAFVVALGIGATTTSVMLEKLSPDISEGAVVAAHAGGKVESPEIYNSAFSPSGARGGEIVPASCSIGYPSDEADGWAPCPNPTVNITPSSKTLVGGGTFTWSYTSANADHCDLSTTMSAPGVGPDYYNVEPTSKTYTNFGPFKNVNGWARYTITCWDVNRSVSGSASVLVTTQLTPTVSLKFGGSSSPFLKINSFVGNSIDEVTGELSWNVTGATSCTPSGSVDWRATSITLPTGYKTVASSASFSGNKTYTLTCTDGVTTVIASTDIFYEGAYSTGCFVAGTKVRMADGSLRDIETVRKDEPIMTSSGPGTIEKLWHIPFKGYIYAFNGSGDYFVTDTHPFMTTEGWKSFNPEGTKKENPDLEVALLEIGDVLLKEDGSTVELTQVDKKYTEEMVYNFKIDGSADYYADGFWVHNVPAK